MKAYERLIKYASYPTASNEDSETCPSTPEQLVFAKALADELRSLGIACVDLDKNGYLFAELPATEGCENAPAIGFIAHMDVSPEAPCHDVNTSVVKYQGGDITLNAEKGIVMREEDFPVLSGYHGKTLVVTDGTTLLGADDKAGVAEIITAAERMINEKTPHGKIMLGFTPDEEIGRGADLFDVERFGAKYAYTVDGGSFGEVDFETFNADSLSVEITGKGIHPGDAKHKMINASAVAIEYDNLLPSLERPQYTEGYEGFYHMTKMTGEVEKAHLSYILRDHDQAKLAVRRDYAERAARELNRKYGEGTVKVTIKESYRNMREMIEPEFHLIENAGKAIREVSAAHGKPVEPVSSPVRGGTDGSRLSFMGLPCPNLGTGSHCHHGRMEFACVEEMDECADLIIRIAEIYAGK